MSYNVNFVQQEITFSGHMVTKVAANVYELFGKATAIELQASWLQIKVCFER